MTYDEFVAHLAGFAWRINDTSFITALDGLITMADASITRDLRIERRHAVTQLGIIAEDTLLPDDYHSMRSVAASDDASGVYEYAEPSVIYDKRTSTKSRTWIPLYSLINKTLLLSGPADPADPFPITVNYRNKIPSFKLTDTSWLADDYLDLYTYAVLKHSGMYLREDARMASWAGLYAEAIEKLNEDSAFEQARGVPRAMPLPRAAGIQRRHVRRGKY